MKITKLHLRFLEFLAAISLWFDTIDEKFVSIWRPSLPLVNFSPHFSNGALFIYKFNLFGDYTVAKNNEVDCFFCSLS